MKYMFILAVVLILSGCTDKFSPKVDHESLIVQPLTVGPMIGNVTDKSFRLWGRGTESAIGVARIRNVNKGNWSKPRFFKLKKDADYTGTINYSSYQDQKLTPQTNYEYQIGYIHKKYESRVSKVQWRNTIPSGTVRTFPKEDSSESTRFILGSCRDQTLWSQNGEDTFKNIEELLKYEKKNVNEPNSSFIIQSGDQVYVDINGLTPFISKGHTDINEFWKTYRKAFSLPNYSAVLKNLPTYMIMDDHEIQNDWSKGHFSDDEKYDKKTHEVGLVAYKAYQYALNMNSAIKAEKKINHYGYKFSHAKSDFFVLDTRSENMVSNKLIDQIKNDNLITQDPQIISNDQMEELKVWLTSKPKNHVKFIVSPIPPFPDTKGKIGSPNDKWGSAVWQRYELFEFIRQKKIKRVVFLSGDLHVSFISELAYYPKKDESNPDQDFRIYNVTSSAFNWSTTTGIGLQEANLDFGFEYKPMKKVALGYKWNDLNKTSTPPSNYAVRRYRSTPNTPLKHKKNNFSRITANNDEINIEFFSGHTGKLLESTTIRF